MIKFFFFSFFISLNFWEGWKLDKVQLFELDMLDGWAA